VPIDAKFPLEAGRRLAAAHDAQERAAARALLVRDVRRHVDAIAQRYVRPEDGTVDFALMYVASESVYHQAILDDGPGEDLYSYCLRQRVLPVSPNTFYAYLMSLVLGLRGLEMEERSKEVLQAVDSLREGLKRFEEDHQRVGTHLGNAASAYARSERRLERWSLSLEKLEGLKTEEIKGDAPK
jgi:DNA recombination protein RmuC